MNCCYKVRGTTADPDHSPFWETTAWMDAERTERCAAEAITRGDKNVESMVQESRPPWRSEKCHVIPGQWLLNYSGYAINALDS